MGPPPPGVPGKVFETRQTPILTLLQIVAVQTIHYLSLSLLIPPMLLMFAEPNSLHHEGGAANVGA
jgi:hypothetical protein